MNLKKISLHRRLPRLLSSVALFLALSVFTLLPSHAARSQLPIEEIREFAKILEVIQKNYVEETDDAELMREAIRGMLRDLDPYSVYLDKRQKKELTIRTQGKFGGLGIQVSYEKNAVKVISPIDDTPAYRAGVQSLDRIIAIDGVTTAGLDLEQAVDKMRGKPGTKITLTIRRAGEKLPLEIELVREVIRLKSVKMVSINDGYAYSRISGFQSETASDLSRLIKNIAKQQKGQLRGMILDLRNNPGGLLSAAIGVSDIFLKEGVIVSTHGRTEKSNHFTRANGYDLTNGLQVLVLINQGSASASEIVAGALQDHDRALLVGSKSFGKGTVQSIIEISPNASIKLTTARYATPSGRFIHKLGIVPDIKISPPVTNKTDVPKNLPEGITKDAQALFERDTQLQEAYSLLRRLVSVGSVTAMKGT